MLIIYGLTCHYIGWLKSAPPSPTAVSVAQSVAQTHFNHNFHDVINLKHQIYTVFLVKYLYIVLQVQK